MSLETLRRHAREIFDAGLQAVNPKQAILHHLSMQGSVLHAAGQFYDLDDYEHIYVVGAGKAGASMAQGIEALLVDRISRGIITVKYDHGLPTQIIELRQAGHPVPDQSGIQACSEVLKLLETAGEKDLVICLLSGGASALLSGTAEAITLVDKQQITEILLRCGASIREINTIRKHISTVKGGRLARQAWPATLLTLILSDVIGDPLDVIASGPTVPDSSTFADCFNILDRYRLIERIPDSIRNHLTAGADGRISETPKPQDPIFGKTQNMIIASNALALQAADVQARGLGYHTLILSGFFDGETHQLAKAHAAIAKEILHSANPLPRPACIISGGETTVTVRGNGLGGRNQEFVLAGALEIDGLDETILFSAGTDGTDGPTDAAGAIADGNTIQRACKISLNSAQFIDNNDSYHYFEALNDLVLTGPTQTNVMDLRILLVGNQDASFAKSLSFG